MTGPRVQVYGRLDQELDQCLAPELGQSQSHDLQQGPVRSLAGDGRFAVLRLADPFGLHDDLAGERLADPDLHLELHTREYYARFMPPGAPRAVWFLNLPGGYFHNEALLDHYDFVFYTHLLGVNYRRWHSSCRFAPPFLPEAWTRGQGQAGDPGREYVPGLDLGREDLAGILASSERLRGRYLGCPQEVLDLPFVYGLCLKADEVLVDAASPLNEACRACGAGLYEMVGGERKIVAPCLDLEERRGLVLGGCLLTHRVEGIVRECLGKGR